jgi:hypothetical protein
LEDTVCLCGENLNLIKVYKMPHRGPYKQYEVDASIAVPKSTLHDRRKRRLVEVDDHVDNEVDNYVGFQNNTHPLPLYNEQVYLDDHDLQVRHLYDIHLYVKVFFLLKFTVSTDC